MDYARIFKALGDKSRLEIVEMLAGGEKCACKLLEKFNFSQPTLSHHMKILCDSGIVASRKEGKWMYYSLSDDSVREIIGFLKKLTKEIEK
ncbi:MAG: helix-turn-helix transcriptional regulator [Ruminococcus sp.]|nr:helix-turn-helix transcriptional regulator [Ruminococcus sp.]